MARRQTTLKPIASHRRANSVSLSTNLKEDSRYSPRNSIQSKSTEATSLNTTQAKRQGRSLPRYVIEPGLILWMPKKTKRNRAFWYPTMNAGQYGHPVLVLLVSEHELNCVKIACVRSTSLPVTLILPGCSRSSTSVSID